MSYPTGRSKSLDDITLENCLEYPIWEWALDEEGVPGQDETWQRPILGTDVTAEMFDPTITFAIKGTQLHGSGTYDHAEKTLTSIVVWKDGGWMDLKKVSSLTAPVVLIAQPSIRGIADVEFICEDLRGDTAHRSS